MPANDSEDNSPQQQVDAPLNVPIPVPLLAAPDGQQRLIIGLPSHGMPAVAPQVPCIHTPVVDESTNKSADYPIYDIVQVPDLLARSLRSGCTRG